MATLAILANFAICNIWQLMLLLLGLYLHSDVPISVSLSLLHVTFSTIVMKACMSTITMFVESNFYSTWESSLMGLLVCNGDE